MGRNWSKDDEARLRVLWSVDSWQQLLEEFPGRSKTSLEQKAGELGLHRGAAATKTALLSRPQSQRRLAWDSIPRYDAFDNLTGDGFAISADWHIPMVDPEMVRLYLDVSKQHRLTRALILGDFLNEDQFSHYVQAGLSPSDVKFGDELIFAAQVLEELLIAFNDGIYFVRGNHEDRILRVLKWSLGVSDVFALIGRRVAQRLQHHLEQKARISDYSFVHVNSSWFCAHPSTYSKVPMAVARDVAEIEQMHTILGNGHGWGLCKDRSGKWYCVDAGCMVDPKKIWYKTMKITRHPAWVQGFVLLKGNRPVMVDRAES
ncbi:MAG TPA: hypothetical protein VJM51_08365 [Dehalococcoidia bacterium]|nr:hypothetical protein [Dehalococcoidia bacterium]